MSKIRALFAAVTLMGIGGFVAETVRGIAHAAPMGAQDSKMDNGAVNVTTAAAIAVPAACLVGMNSFAIYNNGPNTIWCGKRSTVDNTTGFPVAPGAALNVDIACPTQGSMTFYCRADTADQVSPANTRYLRVR